MFYTINGSNARAYEMFLTDPVSKNRGPTLWVVGTDGGYLDKPVPMGAKGAELVMMPGERYLVIVDFKDYQAGVVGPNGVAYSGQWLLKNTARAPFPGGGTPNGATAGRIMQFNVVGTQVPDNTFNPASPGITLRGGAGQGPAIVRLVNPAAGTLAHGVTVQKTRQLTLNEVMGMPQTTTDPVTGQQLAFPGGGYDPMTGLAYPPQTYIPGFGPPLNYNTGNPNALGGNPDINAKSRNKSLYLSGAIKPPLPQEAGWKDTVIAYPGQVTRIVVRWAPTGLPANTAPTAASYPFDPNALGAGYVWHCHIVDHEDNEMMRPDKVTPNTGVNRDYTQGSDGDY